eukprot:scaffold103639_cov67-Attheya_sp.AAC.5
MSGGNNHPHGHIHVSQCSTNDAEIIDATFDISPETQAAIQGTENCQRTENMRREHHNQIKRIYMWWGKTLSHLIL